MAAGREFQRIMVLNKHFQPDELQDLACFSGRQVPGQDRDQRRISSRCHQSHRTPAGDGFNELQTHPNQSVEGSDCKPLSSIVCIAFDGLEGGSFFIKESVKSALKAGKPVVALESTIVCHGMPFPQNLKTAQEVENIIRTHGAEPATIAVIAGVVHVGLNNSELEGLARRGLSVKKTARRDIAYVVARKMDGATTVSATMFFAAKVGIRVFVTGGIGGVHRGAESSMDISSDLTELGRTPVAVVCAGVKSILDIPRTLEYLETQGVAVAALASDEFPAFFTPHSGCKAPCRLNSEEECAELIDANLGLGLESGIVIGVPIPQAAAAESEKVEDAIQRALVEARDTVSGADSTPFLLKRVSELTGGASLAANIALVKNNAMVGARIAKHLAFLHRA